MAWRERGVRAFQDEEQEQQQKLEPGKRAERREGERWIRSGGVKERIRERARELGFDECRFTVGAAPQTAREFETWLAQGRHGEMQYLARNAPKRVDPQLVLSGAKSVIVLAASYARPGDVNSQQKPIKAVEEELRPELQGAGGNRRLCNGGTIARYAQYEDYHHVLAERLRTLSGFVDETVGNGARSLWYVDTGPVLERDLAQRAGVGFIGKHTNLIHRRLGNWFFLAEILTTAEFEPDPAEKNHCGTCMRCLAACPTGAIRAPFQLDARLCISYLTIELKGPIPVELRPAIGNRIYGCDDCLAACPWNRFARQGNLMKAHARSELRNPDLIEILSLDEQGFRRRFSGTPLLRAKRRGLLRNVCVALGNSGDGAALSALEGAARDPEPLIAEHARWALERIRARGAK